MSSVDAAYDLIRRVVATRTLHETAADAAVLLFIEKVISGTFPGDSTSEEDVERWVARATYRYGPPPSTVLSEPGFEVPPMFIEEERAALLEQTVQSLSTTAQRRVRWILEDPPMYRAYLVGPSDPREKAIVSTALRKYFVRAKLVSERSLNLGLLDMDKALVLGTLHQEHPALFVLLLKCGSVESFTELLQILQGTVIKVPSPEDLDTYLLPLRTNAMRGVTSLLRETDNVAYDSSFVENFAMKAVERLTQASDVVSGNLGTKLEAMPAPKVVALYAKLQRMLSSVLSKV